MGLKETQVFLGEVGIARDICGAAEYLRDVLACAAQQGWSSCVYAFREKTWSGMDYELGSNWESIFFYMNFYYYYSFLLLFVFKFIFVRFLFMFFLVICLLLF
jgi:hypothetical protein